MGPVSGLLWLSAAVVAIVCRFLPGAPDDHDALFWGLVAFTVIYATASITRLIPWERVSIEGHVIAVLALQPLIVAGLWLTGGRDAYMGPMLVLPMLYVAYFFPPIYAWPLASVEVLTYASPLVTSPGEHHLLIARTVAYAVGYAGLTLTIQYLKRRLVNAERHQRRIARLDPLTGLENRRAFDEALDRVFADSPRFTVILADVDAFKQINDTHGHTAGDRVLRELAARVSAVVRSSDCLARIGGDELALVAPGAGPDAATRLASALRDAAAEVDTGHGPLSLTVSWAVYPDDGADRTSLMRALDRDLHRRKDARRT
jgi:diguanylate cyclase (GGDEF)-like protein